MRGKGVIYCSTCWSEDIVADSATHSVSPAGRRQVVPHWSKVMQHQYAGKLSH